MQMWPTSVKAECCSDVERALSSSKISTGDLEVAQG